MKSYKKILKSKLKVLFHFYLFLEFISINFNDLENGTQLKISLNGKQGQQLSIRMAM